jgi:transcriptional regulator with XRE-family HTH domain
MQVLAKTKPNLSIVVVMSTLAERVNARLNAIAPKKQADLARATGVKASSIAGWVNGKTKHILAHNIFAAAEFLECDPYWLATGEIKHYPAHPGSTTLIATEAAHTYDVTPWPFETITHQQWSTLPERDKGRLEHIIVQEIAAAHERKKKAA